jgi:iturin family lipopeptide synthetase A
VITSSTLRAPGNLPTILVDRLPAVPGLVQGHRLAPSDVAYVLFTSGSTGEPKGVLIEHRSIANYTAWLEHGLGLSSVDVMSWFASPAFDMSVSEVWTALRVGATLHITPPELQLDPAGLRDWIVKTGITVAIVPTPVGELLLEQPWPDNGSSLALRHMIVGGDVLRRRPPPAASFTMWNGYGPTEAAVVSTWSQVLAHGAGLPAIGRPLPGTWVRVIDTAGRRVPVGIPGELLLGGQQLARGYVNPTPKHAARFVGAGPERVYRTGDVVRWRADGELEFLSRVDQQVQIRGFRVEPGEVEHQLNALPGVREAAVLAWTDANSTVRLAAYVVPAEDVTTAALRAELATRVPEYMVPATWHRLAKLPLATNGKVDRRALPEPALSGETPVADPPGSSDLERRLRVVWAQELGCESVPPDATFFELGGYSLTAIRLVNRIQSELGVQLKVLELLRRPTINDLIEMLEPAWAEEP